MGGGPEDHGAQRPDSGPIGHDSSRSPGSGEQAGEDFRGVTIQPQIHHRESKGNPEGRAPARNVGLGLDRFGLGLWDRLKLCVHFDTSVRKRLRIGHQLSLQGKEAQVVTVPAVLQHLMKLWISRILWCDFQKLNKTKISDPKYRGAFPLS